MSGGGYCIRRELAGFNVDEWFFDEIVVVGDDECEEEIKTKIDTLKNNLENKFPSVPVFSITIATESESKKIVDGVKENSSVGVTSLMMNVEKDEEVVQYEEEFRHQLTILRNRYGFDTVEKYIYLVYPMVSLDEGQFLKYRRQNRLGTYHNKEMMLVKSDNINEILNLFPSEMDLIKTMDSFPSHL